MRTIISSSLVHVSVIPSAFRFPTGLGSRAEKGKCFLSEVQNLDHRAQAFGSVEELIMFLQPMQAYY